MKYGEVLNRSFKALKSGPLWGFSAGAYAAAMLPLYVAMSAFFLIFSRQFDALTGTARPSFADVAPLLGALGLVLVGMVASILPQLIFAGGLVHMANAAVGGQPARVGEGWAVGARRIGRTFGVVFLTWLAGVGAMLVISVPLVALFVFAVSRSGTEPTGGAIAGVILGLCCGFALLYALLLAVLLIWNAWLQLSLGYGIIGDRTVGDALKSGWKALRARIKNVIVFSLIVFGLSLAYQMASSVITTPVQFLSGASTFDPRMFTDPGYVPDVGRMYSAMPLIYAVSFLLMFPITVFNRVLWVAFFREVTGLDVAPAFPDAPPAPPQQWQQPADPAAPQPAPAPDYAPPAPPVSEPPAPPADEPPAPAR